MPLVLPRLSTHGVGSTPANSTKKVGVVLEVSLYVASISNGFWKTYTSPIISAINERNAVVTRSGRIARNKIKRSNGLRIF